MTNGKEPVQIPLLVLRLAGAHICTSRGKKMTARLIIVMLNSNIKYISSIFGMIIGLALIQLKGFCVRENGF